MIELKEKKIISFSEIQSVEEGRRGKRINALEREKEKCGVYNEIISHVMNSGDSTYNSPRCTI